MKNYFTSLLIVTLCYGVGLYSPAATAKVQTYNHAAVRNYINGKGKKSVRDMFVKFEKDLPSHLYERAMKATTGNQANAWFDSAKMGSNYAYMRVGKVKLFARVVNDKGQDVILLNGEKITEKDFSNLNALQAKIIKVYANELYSKKGIFSFFFDSFANKSFAKQAEVAEGTPAIVGKPAGISDACAEITTKVGTAIADPSGVPDPQIRAKPNDKELADMDQKNIDHNCGFKVPPSEVISIVEKCKNDPQFAKDNPDKCEKKDNKWLWILLGLGALALILFLLMKKKKDKKKPPTEEKPELDCTVTPKPPGCPDGRPDPDGTDPTNPIVETPVDDTPTTPTRPDPQPEVETPTDVPESENPNGRDDGDPAGYNPTYKTNKKARVKTQK